MSRSACISLLCAVALSGGASAPAGAAYVQSCLRLQGGGGRGNYQAPGKPGGYGDQRSWGPTTGPGLAPNLPPVDTAGAYGARPSEQVWQNRGHAQPMDTGRGAGEPPGFGARGGGRHVAREWEGVRNANAPFGSPHGTASPAQFASSYSGGQGPWSGGPAGNYAGGGGGRGDVEMTQPSHPRQGHGPHSYGNDGGYAGAYVEPSYGKGGAWHDAPHAQHTQQMLWHEARPPAPAHAQYTPAPQHGGSRIRAAERQGGSSIGAAGWQNSWQGYREHAPQNYPRNTNLEYGGGGGGGGSSSGGIEGGGGSGRWVQQNEWKHHGSFQQQGSGGRGARTKPPPPVHKSELLRKILEARTREALANWVLEVKRRGANSMHSFAPVHVLTSLNRMTKLQPTAHKGTPEQARSAKLRYLSAINSLFARALRLAHSLNARGVATVIHAAGSLNRNDTEGLQVLVGRVLEKDVCTQITAMGFSNMLWALGKAKFSDRELIHKFLALVYFGEQEEQRQQPFAGGGDANEPTRRRSGGGHLWLGEFNAMDLCNCLGGLSLMRMHAQEGAGVAGGQGAGSSVGVGMDVGAELFEACLQRSCIPSVVTSLSSVNIKQVLEACKLVGCAGDARLESLLSVLLARVASVPEIAAAALAGTEPAAASESLVPGARVACSAAAEAAVKLFDGDRRSVLHIWLLTTTTAATTGAGASAELSRLFGPLVCDLGLLSYARRADVMLLLDALLLSPSATLAARVLQRAILFDEFFGGRDGKDQDEQQARGSSSSALSCFSFNEILRIGERIALSLGPAAEQNPEFPSAMEALRTKVASSVFTGKGPAVTRTGHARALDVQEGEGVQGVEQQLRQDAEGVEH